MATFEPTLLYTAAQVAMRRFRRKRIPTISHYLNTVTGNDANDGLSDATAWKTVGKVTAAAGAGTLTAGHTLGISNNSVFGTADRLVFSAGSNTAINGASEDRRFTITHYDPGGYPNDRPTWRNRTWTPAPADWTWDAVNNAWYYTHPNARTWGRSAYVRIAGQWGQMVVNGGYAALNADRRCYAPTGSGTRLYVWAPAGTDPTTYYASRWSGSRLTEGGIEAVIEVCDTQDGCISFAGCGNFVTVDGLRFHRVGLGIIWSNYSFSANLNGFCVQDCDADYVGMFVRALQDSNSSYTMRGSVIGNRTTNIGAECVHLYCKATGWRISGNWAQDVNAGMSYGGCLYVQEGATGTTALFDKRLEGNYCRRAGFNRGDAVWDGCFGYNEVRGRGWRFSGNFCEEMHVAFQTNSGLPLTASGNICSDVDVLCLCGDEQAVGNLAPTFEDNTMVECRLNAYVNGGMSAPAPVWLLSNAGAGRTVNWWNNSVQFAAGVSAPVISALDDTTITADGNHVGSSVTSLVKRANGSTSNPGRVTVADIAMDSSFCPPSGSPIEGRGYHTRYRLDARQRMRQNPPTPGANEPRAGSL